MREISGTEVPHADASTRVIRAAGLECDTSGGGMIARSARGLPVRSP